MGQVQFDTEIKFNSFCNISYSFVLKQIHYKIPVNGGIIEFHSCIPLYVTVLIRLFVFYNAV